MAHKVVNSRIIVPAQLEPGDVMLVTVKLMVMRRAKGGPLLYRVYVCPWEGDPEGPLPQGAQAGNMTVLAEQLFPVITWAGGQVEP